jgi:glutamyl-Q tRNA(Asp) synthetase
VPLVLGENGEKLSKQNGAQALDLSDPSKSLKEARKFLKNHGMVISPQTR